MYFKHAPDRLDEEERNPISLNDDLPFLLTLRTVKISQEESVNNTSDRSSE